MKLTWVPLIGISLLFAPSGAQLAPEWGPLLEPEAGTWPENHCAIHWVHLKGGKMLSWGYGTNDPWTTQTYVYDGFTGEFLDEPTPGQFKVNDANLFCAGHAQLTDGKAHVAGGETGNPSGTGIPNAYTFSPSTLAWTRVGDMGHARWYPTLTTLSDGRVAAISGWVSSINNLVSEIDLFSQSAGTWVNFEPSPLVQPHFYPFSYTFYDPAAPSAQKVVFVGKSTWPWSDQSYVLTINGNSGGWAPVAGASGMQGAASVMIINQTEPLDRGTIYKFGGIWNSPANVVPWGKKLNLNNFPLFWETIADMTTARTECNAVLLPDGTVAIIGGTSDATNPHNYYATRVPTAQIFYPNSGPTGSWGPLSAPMERSRMYHSIASLGPTTAVITGGGEYKEDGTGLVKREFNGQMLYPPYTLIDSQQPIITGTTPATTVLYNGMLEIKSPDADDVVKVALLRLGSTTHANDMDQRFINMTIESQGGGTISVYNPKNAGIAPPGYYMLFLVSSAGVPSVGKYMQVTN